MIDSSGQEHEGEHGDLNLGMVLKRVGGPRAEIQECCEKKGRDITELSDADWAAELLLFMRLHL